MQRLGHIMTHLRLVLRMGHATGTDLVRAHRAGRLSPEEWADMVQHCRGCEWASSCPDWLDDNETADAAPQNCRNRDRFAELQAQKSQVN